MYLARALRQIAPYSHGTFSDNLAHGRLMAPLDSTIGHHSGKSATLLNMNMT